MTFRKKRKTGMTLGRKGGQSMGVTCRDEEDGDEDDLQKEKEDGGKDNLQGGGRG